MATRNDAHSGKKSFILHHDLYDTIRDLEDCHIGQLIRGAFEWNINGEEIEIDPSLKLTLKMLISQFKRDTAKYVNISIKRSEAGYKGGVAKKANASKRKQNKQTVANLADSDSDSDSVNDNVSDRYSSTEGREFLSRFNEVTGKSHRKLPSKAFSQFKARIKEGYTIDDLIKATENAMKSDYHKESGLRHLTPELITRGDKLELWLNTVKEEEEELFQ